MGTAPDEALGLRFKVKVDDVAGILIGDLGDWQKCEGLSVEFDIFEYKEGGENGYIHRLPGRAKYQNVKLTRPINPQSGTVAKWVATVLASKATTTAIVSVLDASGVEVAHWNLTGVYPARWTGPTLDVTANQVAIEVLEMAHNGFLGN
jgi:phage tail-like protein